jgi:vancomycin resistance protein YoaR
MTYPNQNHRPRRFKYARLDRFDSPSQWGRPSEEGDHTHTVTEGTRIQGVDPNQPSRTPNGDARRYLRQQNTEPISSDTGHPSDIPPSAASMPVSPDSRGPRHVQRDRQSNNPQTAAPAARTGLQNDRPVDGGVRVSGNHESSQTGNIPSIPDAVPEKRVSAKAKQPHRRARDTHADTNRRKVQSEGSRRSVPPSGEKHASGPARLPRSRQTGISPRRLQAGSGSYTESGGGKAWARISLLFNRFLGWFSNNFRSSRAFAVTAIVVLFLVAAGVVDAGINHDKIYANVSIGEVDVSGMTQEEAAQALEDTYGSRITGTKIYIYADQDTMDQVNAGKKFVDIESNETVSTEQAAAERKRWKTSASTLQVRMEYANLAHQAYEVGRSDGSIFGRLYALFFGRHLDASVSMNDSAVGKLADSINKTLGNPRKNYGIKVTDGKATVTKGHDGNEIDEAWLRSQLSQRFTDSDNSKESNSFVAEINYAPLQVTEEMAQQVADEVNTAIAPGATFNFEDSSWTASASDIGKWITTGVEQSGDSYSLEVHLDTDKARTAVLKHIKPQFTSDDVKVEFQKDDQGNVTVHTSATGDMPKVSDAISTLEDDLFGEGADHSQTPTVQVESTPIPESLSVDEALDYGIISVVSSYETEYTANADERNHNIHLAADLINNSIIKADGGKWSFNGTTGECNEEKGFEGAGTIVAGETVDEVGGGICQVATTVFNCVYEGGYEVVTRHNHSLYIASYPDGRDAAVSWPDLDLVWKNDSNSDLLMRTSHTSTTVTVELLGVDPDRTVTTSVGKWKSGEKYSKVTETDSSLPKGYKYIKQYGSDGKSISVVRTVKDADGKVIHQDTFTSVYDAMDEITVKGTAS